jgi:hypothetical protein
MCQLPGGQDESEVEAHPGPARQSGDHHHMCHAGLRFGPLSVHVDPAQAVSPRRTLTIRPQARSQALQVARQREKETEFATQYHQ